MLNPRVSVNRAMHPRDPFGLRDWWRVLVRVFNGIGEKQLSLMSAGVAFFAMLALFPAITAVISIFGYFANPRVVQEMMQLMQPILPNQVYNLVNGQIVTLLSARPEALGIATVVSLLFAVWSARAGVMAMMGGLHAIAREADMRNFFWNLVVAYSLTLLLILVTLIALSSVVIIPTILAFFPLGGWTGTIVNWSRWAVAIVAVAIGIGTLYRFGPSRRRRRPPWFTIGSLTATVLWVIGSVLISVYLGNFANYNELYGSLGAVIALLMWFYVSAFAVMLGAELNAEIEEHGVALIRQNHPDRLLAENAPPPADADGPDPANTAADPPEGQTAKL